MNRLIYLHTMIFIGALSFMSCSATDQAVTSLEYDDLSPFAVSYEKIQPQQAAPYDVIIVEPNHYNKSEVTAIKSTGTMVLAYVSLGEVNPDRWYYSILEERGFLGKNENWNSYYINLEDSVTYNLFFDKVFPELAFRGYDGFFLDTIDAVAPYTDRNHLQPHMARLINQIHTEYPDHIIIQNAGLFLLNKTAPAISAVLIEDVATHYDFQANLYTLKEKPEFEKKAAQMKKLSENSETPFLILDFAKDDILRTEAVKRLDTLAFPYFISSIELNALSDGTSGNHY